MKPAQLIPFPSEFAAPVSTRDPWTISLDHLCPTLDPILAVVRERGKPPRVVRMEPEPAKGKLP